MTEAQPSIEEVWNQILGAATVLSVLSSGLSVLGLRRRLRQRLELLSSLPQGNPRFDGFRVKIEDEAASFAHRITAGFWRTSVKREVPAVSAGVVLAALAAFFVPILVERFGYPQIAYLITLWVGVLAFVLPLAAMRVLERDFRSWTRLIGPKTSNDDR